MEELSESHESLPREGDFDPWGGDLDAQTAWRNFGGLSVAEAYTKFLKSPDHYSEDFCSMGGVAFAFYFPVFEYYVRDAYRESELNAVVFCLRQQFQQKDPKAVTPLRARVLELIRFVEKSYFAKHPETDGGARLPREWQELRDIVSAT